MAEQAEKEKGRYAIDTSTMTELEKAQLELAYTQLINNIEVQDVKLQQQGLSTYGAILAEEARISNTLIESAIKLAQANAQTYPAVLRFIADINKRMTEHAADTVFMLGDEKASERLNKELSSLRGADLAEAVRGQLDAGRPPEEVYKIALGDHVKQSLHNINSIYNPSEIPTLNKRVAAVIAAEGKIREMFVENARGINRQIGGELTEQQIQSIAVDLLNEIKAGGSLSGAFHPKEEEEAAEQILKAGDFLTDLTGVAKQYSAVGIPKEAWADAFAARDRITKLTEGGPAGFLELAASIPTPTDSKARRERLEAEREDIGKVEDPLIAKMNQFWEIPGVPEWAEAMGFKTVPQAYKWAIKPKNYEEFLSQIPIALDPNMDADTYAEMLAEERQIKDAEMKARQEGFATVGTSRRSQRLGTKEGRDGILRRLIGRGGRGGRAGEEDEIPFGKREDLGTLDYDDPDAWLGAEGVEPAETPGSFGTNEDGSVWVVEPGDPPYRYEFPLSGDVYFTELPDGKPTLATNLAGRQKIIEYASGALVGSDINLPEGTTAKPPPRPAGTTLDAADMEALQSAITGAIPGQPLSNVIDAPVGGTVEGVPPALARVDEASTTPPTVGSGLAAKARETASTEGDDSYETKWKSTGRGADAGSAVGRAADAVVAMQESEQQKAEEYKRKSRQQVLLDREREKARKQRETEADFIRTVADLQDAGIEHKEAVSQAHTLDKKKSQAALISEPPQSSGGLAASPSAGSY